MPSSRSRTAFETLHQTLKRLHGHKDKLLLVLKRSDIPLLPMAANVIFGATS
jgi:hypothetical protein